MSDAKFSIGGFSLKGDESLSRRAVALQELQSKKEAQAKRQHTLQKQSDRDVVKIASVSLGQWEVEKEKRVKTAFDRIIEKEWYDKYEMDLKAAEQNHINAVREHFSMRRDKIKTPCPSVVHGGVRHASHNALQRRRDGTGQSSISTAALRNGAPQPTYTPFYARSATKNTMHALEWAENVDALDQLGSEGNFVLQDRFLTKVKKDSAARRRAHEEQVFAVRQLKAAEDQWRRDAHNTGLLPAR